MPFKFIAALAFVAVVSAYGYAPSTQVLHEEPLQHTAEQYDPNPQYTFTYGINDYNSGDHKSQTETRNGDVVHGEYSLIDADGYKRIVKYTADDVNGFNAVVDRHPIPKVHVAAPAVVKAVPAPVAVKSVAPVTYTVPSYIKTAPVSYTVVRQQPSQITYTAPTLIKSIPRSVLKPTLAYSSRPAIFRSIPLAYNAPVPTLIRRANVAYAAPSPYTTQTLVKSAPATYGAW